MGDIYSIIYGAVGGGVTGVIAAIVAVTVVATTIISKSDLFKAKQQCYSRKRPNLGECRRVA